MSYNGKFTSFVSVVESAFRDSGLDYIDFEHAAEWTAELIGLLGTPYAYVDKVTDGLDGNPGVLKVEDYRCSLPYDLERLNSVIRVSLDGNGSVSSYSEMIETSNLFHPLDHNDFIESSSSEWNPLVSNHDVSLEDEEFTFTEYNTEIDTARLSTFVQNEYKLDDGYIFTNFKDGYIQLSYRGFAIDPDGFPLIPDDQKFKEALKYHIIFKNDWRTWRMNPSPQNKSIVNDSEQRRDFYVGAARNKSHIPSVDKMESLKNMWLRTNPKVNEHGNHFKSLNKQARRYNLDGRGTRRGY